MGAAFYTNGYPCAPYWSPAYSYGTRYGTGLYNSLAYTGAQPIAYGNQNIIAPTVVTPAPYTSTVSPININASYVSRVVPNIAPPLIQPYSPVVSVAPVAPMIAQPMISTLPPYVNSVAPIASVSPIPSISAITPTITPPLSTQIVAPTSMMGGGFSSGGFNLFGDLDPITPGVQSTPGIISAVGPTRVF